MMQRNQLMPAQTANAIMMQQQRQRVARNNSPTVIPHNSANVESQTLCNYSQYLCKREKVQGYEFCSRHILDDKNSAFKQCNFQYRTHRRCPRPAPKTDRKDGYCTEHSRKAMIARQRTLGKRPHSDPVHRYLDELSHYKRAKPVEVKTEIPTLPQNGDGAGQSSSHLDLETDIAPFLIASQPTRVPSPPPNRAFDFCSDAESDADSATVETAWRGDADSDADSVDSEMENPLKHAGAYSAEEVIRIMRDKLIRLQKLYIDQFQRLQYLLKEERRQYRVSLRKEHEAELMSIQRQPNEGLEDRIAYDQLKALNHYNRPSGNEAVLHGKLMERRVRLSEANSNLIASNLVNLAGKLSTSSATVPKCSFNITSSVKCGEICIPMTKFCQKHILSDPNQVLFRQCGFVVTSDDEQHTDDGPCETPIPDVLDSSTCVYHNQLQPAFPTLSIELNTLARADQQYTNSVNMATMDTYSGYSNYTSQL